MSGERDTWGLKGTQGGRGTYCVLRKGFLVFFLVLAGSHWFYDLRHFGIKDLNLNKKAGDWRSSWCIDGNRNNSGVEWAAMYGSLRRARDLMKSTQAVSNFN